MLSILIIAFLIFGLLMGLRRGFILQVLHLSGFIISFMIAALNYKKLSPKLSLWIPYPELSSDSTWVQILQSLPLETGFYNGIAFVLIFLASKIVLQIIASMLDFIAELPILNSLNRLLGAVLGFFEMYLIIFIFLYISVLIPLGFIQSAIEESSIALGILDKTPYFSGKIKDLWFATFESY